MAFIGRQEKYTSLSDLYWTLTINKINVQIFLKTNDINKVLKSAF